MSGKQKLMSSVHRRIVVMILIEPVIMIMLVGLYTVFHCDSILEAESSFRNLSEMVAIQPSTTFINNSNNLSVSEEPSL